MATKTEAQVTWSGADFVPVNTAAFWWSDAISLPAGTLSAALQAEVDNAGTPASGDVCNVYSGYSSGDVRGDTSDDFDTDWGSTSLMQINTYSVNGEDPARKSADVRVGPKAVRFGVRCPLAATRNMTVRMRLVITTV